MPPVLPNPAVADAACEVLALVIDDGLGLLERHIDGLGLALGWQPDLLVLGYPAVRLADSAHVVRVVGKQFEYVEAEAVGDGAEGGGLGLHSVSPRPLVLGLMRRAFHFLLGLVVALLALVRVADVAALVLTALRWVRRKQIRSWVILDVALDHGAVAPEVIDDVALRLSADEAVRSHVPVPALLVALGCRRNLRP